jgi:hypothetical protein
MANKVFSDFNALIKHLENNIVLDIQKIGEEVKNVLRNNVRVLWYERNGMNWTPQDYERTWQLIDSISVSKAIKLGNKYQVEVYYDTDKIVPMYGTEDKPWTRHMSITDFSDVSEAIPFWVEEGNNNSPIYSYEGVYPVKTTIEDLKSDDYIKTRLKELLEMQGYRVIS